MLSDLLPSWNDGDAKRAVLQFVNQSITPGSAYIEPADRIAVFDNDGTLWAEQPLPVQLNFIIRALTESAQRDATLAEQQPYKAILEQDRSFFEAVVVEQQTDAVMALEQALARTWLDKTPDEFEAEVTKYLSQVKSERFDVPYTKLIYKPMLEVFNLLSANDFRIFVCSVGGREFMRVIAESAWGIPKEHIIGTAYSYEYKEGKIRRRDKLLGGFALGPGKVEHIFAYAGRMPAFVGGNSDGDIEMLESSRFAMLVVHDDAEREFAYTKAAEKSVVAAREKGWTLVSMKNDWNTVFS
jgi:phosphoglycolate phosphatase-like HAD superfamily hydrolase